MGSTPWPGPLGSGSNRGAGFSGRGADTTRLEQLHAEQLRDAGRALHPDPGVARELRPYERQRMAGERELRLPPPVVLTRPAPENESRPLTLPSRPRTLVDPIPAQGLGY